MKLYCTVYHPTQHLFQPLDISVYKPLKNHFSTITDFITLASVTHGATRVTVNKTNFTYSINQVQPAMPSDKSAEQNPVIIPATSQDFSTLLGAFKNPLVSAGLISPDIAEILRPVKYEKSKSPRVIKEERVLTEDYWRE